MTRTRQASFDKTFPFNVFPFLFFFISRPISCLQCLGPPFEKWTTLQNSTMQFGFWWWKLTQLIPFCSRGKAHEHADKCPPYWPDPSSVTSRCLKTTQVTDWSTKEGLFSLLKVRESSKCSHFAVFWSKTNRGHVSSPSVLAPLFEGITTREHIVLGLPLLFKKKPGSRQLCYWTGLALPCLPMIRRRRGAGGLTGQNGQRSTHRDTHHKTRAPGPGGGPRQERSQGDAPNTQQQQIPKATKAFLASTKKTRPTFFRDASFDRDRRRRVWQRGVRQSVVSPEPGLSSAVNGTEAGWEWGPGSHGCCSFWVSIVHTSD